MNDSAVEEVKSAEIEAVKEVEKVAEVVLAAVVEISAEEKLILRETELEYLKAVMETQRLQKIIEEKAKAFPAFVDTLVKKYGLDKTKYTFDSTSNSFRKI